jgi:hypothetical protein
MALMGALLLLPAAAAAEEAPRVKTLKGREEATITVTSGRLQIVQKLSRTRVDLQISEGPDTVKFSGTLSGRVTLERAGTRHAFAMRAATPADEAIVARLLGGSTALKSFDGLMNSAWGRTAKPAAAFRASHALLAVFRGDAQPTLALVTAMSRPQPTLMPARRDGPNACWEAYTHDVLRYTYDLEGCVAEARDSWFPLHLAWCSYEYNIKTSLAFWWMLDCYGLL